MDDPFRPRKRRRVSRDEDRPSGDAALLRRRRTQNDMRLKSRFEDIFAKYSNDFSELGDEIDLRTGEVVVNKGHLEAMQDELDVGAPLDDEGRAGALWRASDAGDLGD